MYGRHAAPVCVAAVCARPVYTFAPTSSSHRGTTSGPLTSHTFLPSALLDITGPPTQSVRPPLFTRIICNPLEAIHMAYPTLRHTVLPPQTLPAINRTTRDTQAPSPSTGAGCGQPKILTSVDGRRSSHRKATEMEADPALSGSQRMGFNRSLECSRASEVVSALLGAYAGFPRAKSHHYRKRFQTDRLRRFGTGYTSNDSRTLGTRTSCSILKYTPCLLYIRGESGGVVETPTYCSIVHICIYSYCIAPSIWAEPSSPASAACPGHII